jgi:hypothetical protein
MVVTWRFSNVIPILRRCAGWSAVCLALVVTGAAGCGGDDEKKDPGEELSTATATITGEATTGSEGAAVPTATEPDAITAPPTTPSETQPGGAGDEEPARSLVQLTGRGGRITPRVVRVPAFISIRVELTSADSRPYALRFGKRTLDTGGVTESVSRSFAGLRPGRKLVGRPVGEGNGVRIEATAEPGP